MFGGVSGGARAGKMGGVLQIFPHDSVLEETMWEFGKMEKDSTSSIFKESVALVVFRPKHKPCLLGH